MITSIGEKPVWLGQPQPFLAQPKLKKIGRAIIGPAKVKKNFAGPIMAGPNFWLGQSMT